MKTKTVNVPNFSAEIWNEFKGEVTKKGLKIGDALEEALKLWIEKNTKQKEEK